MEPTSHQPFGSIVGSASSDGITHSENTSPVDSTFSTTAAHATGDNPYPADTTAQPADGSLKGKLDSAVASGKTKLDDAVASGKKWLADTGVADQAQQLPQKAKDLGNQALTKVNGLTTTQKAVSVGIIAAGVAFLLVRGGKKKKSAGEYRDRPRKSPFDHQPSTKDGDHAYDRRGQRPWGNSRYGGPSAPANKPRVASGSGYTSAPSSTHSADHGRTTASSHSAPTGQRRDQGPASGSKYDASVGGSQNPNNLV